MQNRLYLYRKISKLLQKRSLNAIQFEKIIAYQAIWRTPTILSNAYDTHKKNPQKL